MLTIPHGHLKPPTGRPPNESIGANRDCSSIAGAYAKASLVASRYMQLQERDLSEFGRTSNDLSAFGRCRCHRVVCLDPATLLYSYDIRVVYTPHVAMQRGKCSAGNVTTKGITPHARAASSAHHDAAWTRRAQCYNCKCFDADEIRFWCCLLPFTLL